MSTYKLIVAYDGTVYYGWQVQRNKTTVAGALQNTFTCVFNQPCRIIGASRTDTGVHALGQTVLLETQLSLDPQQLYYALNNALPSDMLIRDVCNVENFHPHANVAYKIYHYYLCTERPLPFVARYVWYLGREINFDQLAHALQLFVGTHDFAAFATDCQEKNTVRTIDAITLQYFARYGVWRINVRGKSFLHHMVRRMVGAAVEVATPERNVTIDDLSAILASKNPKNTLFNAPAQGLVLYKIKYSAKLEI